MAVDVFVVLIVVGRDQRALYDYFRWGFGGTPGVEVVLDRRLGERRGQRDGHGSADDRAGARDWGTLR